MANYRKGGLMRRKIIYTTILVLVLALVSIYFIYINISKPTVPTASKNFVNNPDINELQKTTSNQPGGYINGDGFEISYLETQQIYVITIKKEPFEQYKKMALDWLKYSGIDPKNIPYICSVTPDLVGVTKEQVEKCANSYF